MNGSEILRIVDAIHRDKNINPEIVFEGIEQAIISAARKHFGEESDVAVVINRESGDPSVNVDGEELDTNDIGDLLGRTAAQTAKQVMIQKIREAERDALFDEFTAMKGQTVTGSVSQATGGAVTVNLGKVDALLPRGEQIPGEYHRVGERVRAIVLEVKKAGSRVRIILSRTHPELVRRLFELEIPEVGEHVIEVRSLAREAGYRSKVAVSSFDNKVDCVGACVGVRGSRIKNIVDELAGERIDIVRWNDSLTVLVPNALQPAEVEDVILCPMLGKVIVLVQDDQLSLSIGKKGQNVRLASKLVGWDIHVLTQEKLDVQLDAAVTAFSVVPEITEELAENLVAQGFFTFDDLSVIEPDQLAELGGLSAEDCESIVEFADVESLKAEAEERKARELARLQRAEDARLARLESEMAPPAAETEESTTEEKATEESTTEEAASEKPATDEAATEETATDDAATEETVAEESATDDAAIEEPATVESATEELAAEEPAAVETAVEETVTEESAVAESAVEESAVAETEVNETTKSTEPEANSSSPAVSEEESDSSADDEPTAGQDENDSETPVAEVDASEAATTEERS